ncbi:MAG TPA: DUF1801 domain-containing protein [Phycisphaerales bacterium]|nr:DUF1801 domain-containing protein [Phycisphaerales bacterium]
MKKTSAKKKSGVKRGGGTSSVRAAAQRGESGDWRDHTLARVRMLIKQAVPDAVEEVKWRKPSNGMRGVPVWSSGGIICTGETYKSAVKLTFAKGAALDDPAGLFNAGLGGGTRRAIDIREGETINEAAFRALVKAAAALNASSGSKPRPARNRASVKREDE